MEPISVMYDSRGGVLLIGFGVGNTEVELPRTAYTRELDSYRFARYDKDDRLLGVDFLGVNTRGIDLRGVPEAERIAAGLEELRRTLGLVLVS